MEHLHYFYLDQLLSWARHMQQQFDNELNSRGNGASKQEQWYTRFNYLAWEIEETLKRPYTTQHDNVLALSHQANQLYHEIISLNKNSPVDAKVKKRMHHYNKQITEEVEPSAKRHYPHKKATFKALVDTMIPSTWGAVDFQMDEYLIMILDKEISIWDEMNTKTVHLSTPTAVTLDIAATQLKALKATKNSIDFLTYPKEGAFASLSHDERIEAVRLLEDLQVDLNTLPSPFHNDGSLVKFIVTYVFQMVKFGYYSEWIAYGSTRFASPEEQRIETRPFTWDLVGYPGVSYGYRALRGFLIDEFDEEVK